MVGNDLFRSGVAPLVGHETLLGLAGFVRGEADAFWELKGPPLPAGTSPSSSDTSDTEVP